MIGTFLKTIAWPWTLSNYKHGWIWGTSPHTAYVRAHEPTKRVRIGTRRPDMVGLNASDVVGRHKKGKACMISWRTWISKVHIRTNITFSLNISRHHVAYIVQHNISIHKAHKHSIKNVTVHAGARRHALSYIIQLALKSGRTSDKSCKKQTKVGGPHAGTQWQAPPRAGSTRGQHSNARAVSRFEP